mgnify:CR=1 FL=1
MSAAATTVEELWRELVTAALLGTDRREPPVPPIDAIADKRFSGGARRPMVPTSEVTPVPLTPMPIRMPLINRSTDVVAANMK